MDEQTIHSRISALVDQEHALRAGVGRGELAADDERIRLQRVEEELDQCWDLLRQRAARRSVGADPGTAAARSIAAVEGYLQ